MDYRRFNLATVKDAYPLPRIDDTLDMLAGKRWFSTLDLASGYWQVSLSPDARCKTAFTTHPGLFQFKVMPFGLCNAPATFERLMCDIPWFGFLVCWSLTSLCHSNGHIETMPAREINPFTALTRIQSQFLRTQ